MRPIDAEPLEEILRLRCAQCSNAYGSLAGAANGCLKLMQAQPTIAPPPNDPLTLEELREMEGEPVWICDPDGSDGMWALVDLEYELCRTAKGGIAIFDTYGKTWVAYRRRPEKGTA